ncbi:hypothetical protein WEB32_34900 [Streptomyces netropsis]|uniref:hypothetical protein n=1 Tax=Streptomyces netropsis TaxID=55404 RepID=UPI0030D46349
MVGPSPYPGAQKFLEGDHITHAKPRSASGEADLIGDLDGRDPLVCDGKIFDGSGRGKGYLVKGVHQIIKYAHDYGQQGRQSHPRHPHPR